jgi:hypothetical protein
VEGLALLHKYPTICPHLREKPLYHVRGAKMKCYCKERKGHWYFRMRVPKELHPYLPSEISYSIKGLDLETARFRCKLLGNHLAGAARDLAKNNIPLTTWPPNGVFAMQAVSVMRSKSCTPAVRASFTAAIQSCKPPAVNLKSFTANPTQKIIFYRSS